MEADIISIAAYYGMSMDHSRKIVCYVKLVAFVDIYRSVVSNNVDNERVACSGYLVGCIS